MALRCLNFIDVILCQQPDPGADYTWRGATHWAFFLAMGFSGVINITFHLAQVAGTY